MAEEEFDLSQLKIKELPKPPAFGVWLSLLAIGLTLAALRLVLLPLQLSLTTSGGVTIDWLAQLAISAWALVNLILLIKRRRAFINSMIALLGVNAVLQVVLVVFTAITMAVGGIALLLPALGFAISILWLLYLVRSQHVRQVFVR